MKPLNALSVLQNLYTGVIWVGSDLTIRWVNTQTEQLLSVSKSRLVSLNIIDVLMPNKIESKTESKAKNDLTSSAHDSPHKEPNSFSNPDDSCISNTDNNADGNTDYSKNVEDFLKEARSKLEIQFHNAREFQQPFIEYSRFIHGVIYPLYAHYSVTPVEYENEVYFLIEIWQGGRQDRLDKEQRLQEQHDVSREMLRSVAHEVKNPLAGIRGAAQLLIKQTRSSSDTSNETLDSEEANHTVRVDAKKLTTYANIVINESDRLTKLIEQLLGSNQLPDLHYLNIHEPLEHVLLLTQTQYPEVRIIRDYDLSLPEFMADKNQLIQVFLNLVNNACEAMLEQDPSLLSQDYHPQLKLITRIEHQYTIGTVHHRQVIKVSIVDSGAGISDDLIDRIFFPLVTGRASGTGLGLALVQEIIHRHEGAIEVTSEPGNTQFNVYLPLDNSHS